MAANFIDISIIIAFLISSIVIGVYNSKHINSVKDYAIANKNYSYNIMLISIIATMIGGGITVGHASEIYKYGIVFSCAAIGSSISTIFIAKFIAPKFDQRFQHMISIGDMIEYFYGKKISILASISGYIYCISLIAFQIIAFGNITNMLLGINFTFGAIIAGSVIMIYSFFGGIHAVTKTDVLQFFVLVISFPVIAFIALSKALETNNIYDNLSAIHLSVFNNSNFFEYLMLFCFMAMPFLRLQPEFIQRCLMLKDHKSLSSISYKFAGFSLLLLCIITIIALSAVILFPNVNPNSIIPLIIDNFMPIGIKGIVITGLLGVIMSTADSCLNTGTVLLSNNIIRPTKNKLKWMKINTIITAIIATAIGVHDLNIFTIAVLSQYFLGITASIPLFFALLNMNNNNAYKLSLMISISIFLYLTYYTNNYYTAIFISSIGSALSFLLYRR